jgi:hypothetical protein
MFPFLGFAPFTTANKMFLSISGWSLIEGHNWSDYFEIDRIVQLTFLSGFRAAVPRHVFFLHRMALIIRKKLESCEDQKMIWLWS